MYFPGMQFVQTADELAPQTIEYLPASHGMQSVSASFPVVSKYFPAAQFLHVLLACAPSTVEYLPALQFIQSDCLLLPSFGWYLPEMHREQELLDSPSISENVPGAHFKQFVALPLPDSG